MGSTIKKTFKVSIPGLNNTRKACVKWHLDIYPVSDEVRKTSLLL